MAEAALNPNNGLSLQRDELDELRAKKQRQLAALLAEPAALHAATSVPEAQSRGTEAPAAVSPAAAMTALTTVPPTLAEQSTTGSSNARQSRAASPRPDREGQVKISGYFPAETRRQLKIVAARQGKSLQQVMAAAYEAWLRRHDNDG